RYPYAALGGEACGVVDEHPRPYQRNVHPLRGGRCRLVADVGSTAAQGKNDESDEPRGRRANARGGLHMIALGDRFPFFEQALTAHPGFAQARDTVVCMRATFFDITG